MGHCTLTFAAAGIFSRICSGNKVKRPLASTSDQERETFERFSLSMISQRELNALNVSNQLALQPITILNLYVDIDGNHEERIPAFLTSVNHAMFVDRNTGSVMFGGVIPTADPSIYTGDENAFFTELGRVKDSAQDAEIIGQLTAALNSMSAYDFIAKVIIHVEQDVNYAGLIVPNLIQEAK